MGFWFEVVGTSSAKSMVHATDYDGCILTPVIAILADIAPVYVLLEFLHHLALHFIYLLLFFNLSKHSQHEWIISSARRICSLPFWIDLPPSKSACTANTSRIPLSRCLHKWSWFIFLPRQQLSLLILGCCTLRIGTELWMYWDQG